MSLIVNQNMKIVDAAQIMGIRYENAKAIYRVYQLEGRFTKKIFKKHKRPTEKDDAPVNSQLQINMTK